MCGSLTAYDSMDKKIDRNAKQSNAGIASVAAMSNIPYAYSPDSTFSAGLGVGNYRNGNAIAAGGQYRVTKNTNVRASVSWNNTDSAVVGGGIAINW